MTALYGINFAMNYLKEQMEDDEVGTELYKDTLDCILLELEEKADNICCILKEWSSTIEAIKIEEKALYERRKELEKKYDKLYTYLEDTLKSQNISKIETPRNKIIIKKCPPKVVISDEIKFIRWAENNLEDSLRYREPEINKTYVKHVLKSGIIIDNAKLVQDERLQIK